MENWKAGFVPVSAMNGHGKTVAARAIQGVTKTREQSRMYRQQAVGLGKLQRPIGERPIELTPAAGPRSASYPRGICVTADVAVPVVAPQRRRRKNRRAQPRLCVLTQRRIVPRPAAFALHRRWDRETRRGVLATDNDGVARGQTAMTTAIGSDNRRDSGCRAAAMMPAAIGVLRWEDERPAAAVLGRAFMDDPLVGAICAPHAADREACMRWGFRVAIRSHCLMAQPAWTIGDADGRMRGVVMVTRPRAAASANVDVLFALWGLLHIGVRVGWRGATAARIIAEHLPTAPFTYLRTLGVEPECQSRGLGSRLVERVLSTAPTSVPIYLETAKETNLGFYARHGFHCL